MGRSGGLTGFQRRDCSVVVIPTLVDQLGGGGGGGEGSGIEVEIYITLHYITLRCITLV